MNKPTPTRQLPAREAQAKGVLIPYFHPAERDDEPVNYHLTLLLFDDYELERLVIYARKKAAIIRPSETDNRNGNLDYPVTPRESVNFLRHSALNRTEKSLAALNGYSASYDAILFRIQKRGIDVARRQLDFKLSVLRLIATYYPRLALECEEQRFQSIRRFEDDSGSTETTGILDRRNSSR